MEKEIGSKEVKMQVEKMEEQPQKLNYDQLNQICGELSQQVQQQDKYIQHLHKQLGEMKFALQVKRMDYLFKVVELSQSEGLYKFPDTFVTDCVNEIQEALTTTQDEPEKETTKED